MKALLTSSQTIQLKSLQLKKMYSVLIPICDPQT
jgi:hypothetical protein